MTNTDAQGDNAETEVYPDGFDPNVALLILRKAVSDWRTDQEYDIAERLDDALVTFNGLDGWLSVGNNAPDDWERARLRL